MSKAECRVLVGHVGWLVGNAPAMKTKVHEDRHWGLTRGGDRTQPVGAVTAMTRERAGWLEETALTVSTDGPTREGDVKVGRRAGQRVRGESPDLGTQGPRDKDATPSH